MSSVTNEAYTSGALASRERTSYSYDSKSFRVAATTETQAGTALNTENWTVSTRISFLADAHNHTGYTQTIRETKVENGHTLITDYTFGHDEISQRAHGEKADGTAIDQTHVFGHDGHGSGRVLYDLAAAFTPLVQAMTYSAYGQLLALHDTAGVALATTSRLSSLGYSGEHFDVNAQQQYLRARFYSPTTGRFNRLDPFAGNTQDPQSLHKYAYVHGDPIRGVDPSGEIAGLVGGLVSSVMGAASRAASAPASMFALRAASTTIRVLSTRKKLSLGVMGLAGVVTHPRFRGQVTDRSFYASQIDRVEELAALAQATYTGNTLDSQFAGIWTKTLPISIPIASFDEDLRNGFRAVAWEHSSGRVVVSFEGTDDKADIYTDLANGLSIPTGQYARAIEVADWAVEKYGGENVEFTGHSLGGGLATMAAYATGRPATTFNAAGVSELSYTINAILNWKSPIAKSPSIKNFFVAGDALSGVQNWTVAVNASGVQIPLPGIFTLGVGVATGHKMATVRDSINLWRTETEST